MRIIYVAGAYRANSEWAIQKNIRHAEEIALKLWSQRNGNDYVWDAVLCPHKNTQYFSGALPDDRWLKGCLELLKCCQAIYVLDNWKTSKGAQAELKLAIKLDLEIIYEELENETDNKAVY